MGTGQVSRNAEARLLRALGLSAELDLPMGLWPCCKCTTMGGARLRILHRHYLYWHLNMSVFKLFKSCVCVGVCVHWCVCMLVGVCALGCVCVGCVFVWRPEVHTRRLLLSLSSSFVVRSLTLVLTA